MWIIYALLSAIVTTLVAIFGKIGLLERKNHYQSWHWKNDHGN